MADSIRVIPIGDVNPQVQAEVCSAVSRAFSLDCRIDLPLPLLGSAYDAMRAQYSAEILLNALHSSPGERVLGVVDRDLYVPELNFVFGLGDPRGRRAIMALPRLREAFYRRTPAESLFLDRVAKEAIHELGHTYGMSHCSNKRCVMAFSNSLADTDYKSREFCPIHQAQIKR